LHQYILSANLPKIPVLTKSHGATRTITINQDSQGVVAESRILLILSEPGGIEMHWRTPGGKFSKALIAILCTLSVLAACSNERKGLKIGDQAPAFTARNLEGDPISLAAYKGGPVILRFWSTDCKYCRADTPVFNRYFNEYRSQGLGIVYVNMEAGTDDLQQFVASLEIEFPVISDPKGKIAASYNVKLLPQTIILDPDHRIIAVIIGGVNEDDLHDLLGAYLHAPIPDNKYSLAINACGQG
jgi:peroxiredoxin